MTQQKRQFLNFSFVQVRRTHPLGLPRLCGLSTAFETYSIGFQPLPQALLTLAFRLTRSFITYHTPHRSPTNAFPQGRGLVSGNGPA